MSAEELPKANVVSFGLELPLGPSKAFDVLVEELVAGLEALGIGFEPGATGHLRDGELEVGRVVAWEPGRRFELRWRPADWEPEAMTAIECRLQAFDGGTRIHFEHRGWSGQIGDPEELAGWFVRQVAAPALSAMTPAALGDWITDRQARRPSGARSRAIYADPLYHYPNFRVILQELALQPDDHLLEVGCGGGALLKEALRSGCRAAAVDHSPEMARLARDVNREASAEGRLDVHKARADRLPFADATFTCATMTGVLGFLPDPVAAFREIHRVLRPGGRFVGLGSDPRWRGTPAAPEPMASRLRFYEKDELPALAREAGFEEVEVVFRDMEQHARDAGVPEEHVPMFAGDGEQFLIARKT